MFSDLSLSMLDDDTEKQPLKLFVWRNALSDWTSRVMFAMAKSKSATRNAILENGGKGMPSVEQELAQEPRVYDSTVGFFLYGGN